MCGRRVCTAVHSHTSTWKINIPDRPTDQPTHRRWRRGAQTRRASPSSSSSSLSSSSSSSTFARLFFRLFLSTLFGRLPHRRCGWRDQDERSAGRSDWVRVKKQRYVSRRELSLERDKRAFVTRYFLDERFPAGDKRRFLIFFSTRKEKRLMIKYPIFRYCTWTSSKAIMPLQKRLLEVCHQDNARFRTSVVSMTKNQRIKVQFAVTLSLFARFNSLRLSSLQLKTFPRIGFFKPLFYSRVVSSGRWKIPDCKRKFPRADVVFDIEINSATTRGRVWLVTSSCVPRERGASRDSPSRPFEQYIILFKNVTYHSNLSCIYIYYS